MESPGRDQQDSRPAAGNPIALDGTCVRIGAMRCHAQALTVKLNRDVPMDEVNDIIAKSNDWVKVVPNTKEEHAAGSHAHCRDRYSGDSLWAVCAS